MPGRQLRSLVLLVGVPALAAVGGWSAASLVSDPDEVVAAEPTPSLITEEVVATVLESSVVARGDVIEAESFQVRLVGDVGGPVTREPVFTGRLAPVGAEVDEADLLAEISGRPVFVLEGDIPMYRDLGPGAEGDDVEQLEVALHRLGHLAGAPDGEYDAATEAAVRRLYGDLGYPAFDSGARSADGGLAAAEQEVEAAQRMLDEAESARAAADVPPTQGEIMAAEAEVAAAEQDLIIARESGDEVAIAQAEAALQLARERLQALRESPDLTDYDAAVEAAEEELAAATEARDEVAASTGVTVPRGEVVVVPELPRQVGTVDAEVGQAPTGEAFTLVGSTTEVTVALSREEAELVDTGHRAELFEQSWGIDTTGRVAGVDGSRTDGGRKTVRIQPDQDVSDAVGANIRVRIPVGSTDGEVLAVSIASVYTSVDGRTYVDRVLDDTPGAEVTEPVEVELGLASDSLVQITPVDDLAAGDRVAVAGQ